jgi:hypothetical protein
MEFVTRYEHWTIDDWKRVIWSDETRINCFGSDGKTWVWKNPNNKNQKGLYQETPKHGGGSLMMWGCMTYSGAGYISKIDSTMDAALYVEILEECLPLTQTYYGIKPEDVIFQQDNDSKHTSKKAKDFFKDQDINLLFWPANSPDLNPIEHLWSYLKQQLAKHQSPPAGMIELWEHVQEEWNKIPKSICQSLIESMPDHIKAVKAAHGGHTKY